MKNKVALRKWLLPAVALLAGYWMITRVVVFSSVDRYLTPAWFEYRDRTHGPLLRMEHMGESAALLITWQPRDEFADPETETREAPTEPMFPVYRYTPESAQLSLVSASEWVRAKGPSIECLLSLLPCDVNGFRWTRRTETIEFNQRALRTAGSRILGCSVTPNRSKAVIMSAGGPRMFTIIAFFGDPGSFGPHYQQVFSLETGEFMGDTVRLPVITAVDRQYPLVCWSPDEQSIVYAQYQGEWMSIVPVESR